MTTGKTRIVLLVAAALVGAVLAAFAVALLNARDDRRDAAMQRFTDEAQITASVIESAFGSGVPAQTEEYAKAFGDAEVSPARLEAQKRKSQVAYVIVLDQGGNFVAATKGLDPGVRAAIEEGPRHIADVVQGAPWRMSGIVRGANAEYVSPFPAADGSTRLLVQGFPVQLISGFVGGTLAQLPSAAREAAFVVDDNSQVIAAADQDVKPGVTAPDAPDDARQTVAAIGQTDWTVVLTASSEDLFAGVDTLAQWLVLVALALAGGFAILLLMRALRQSRKLESAYAELERSNANLARTNLELQRSNSELEQFASVASHDLQEPLRKVQTFGDQLERRHGDVLDEEGKDFLRRMRNASARMSVLIDDLLRFSRVTTHAKPHVAVDLRRIATDVLSDLEARVADTGGEVHIGTLPSAQADATQMRQLLQNLIGNALKFHREGVPPVVRLDRAKTVRAGHGVLHRFRQRHRLRERLRGAHLPRLRAAASARRLRRHGHRARSVPQDRRAPRRDHHRGGRARRRCDLYRRAAGRPRRGGRAARRRSPGARACLNRSPSCSPTTTRTTG